MDYLDDGRKGLYALLQALAPTACDVYWGNFSEFDEKDIDGVTDLCVHAYNLACAEIINKEFGVDNRDYPRWYNKYINTLAKTYGKHLEAAAMLRLIEKSGGES